MNEVFGNGQFLASAAPHPNALVAGKETARSRNRERLSQSAFRGTRVFTTESTENTEGQRRKAIL
jgi:hypothetical protein